MENILIYILCLIIAILDLTYLKKHIILRTFTVVIIAQTLLINFYKSIEKLEKIGPFTVENYLLIFQIAILVSTIYLIFKFKKHYDKNI